MSQETARAAPRPPTDPKSHPTHPPHPTACAPAADETVACPACGETMRLWANYYRCRNCGYKESCCF